MRVLLVYQHFRFPSEGGGLRPYRIAKHLANRGFDVHVIFGTSRGRDGLYKEVPGAVFHPVRVPYSQEFGTVQRILSFMVFGIISVPLALFLRPGLVYASSTPLTAVFPGIVARLILRSKFIFEVRDLWPLVPIAMGSLRNSIAKWAAELLETGAYKAADHIICLSPPVAEYIGVRTSQDKVSVIPNMSDFEMFGSSRLSLEGLLAREERYLVYAGSFGRVNNVEYLIRLRHELRQHQVPIRFELVGGGSEAASCREYAVRLGLSPSEISFRPKVDRKVLPNILQGSIGVFSTVAPIPELSNNSANKFFDGLAAGRPVILNYGGWQAELLRKKFAGISISATNVKEAAKDLSAFLNSQHDMARAGMNAYSLGKEYFDSEYLLDEIGRIVEGLGGA